MEEVAESIDPRDVGVAAYATSPPTYSNQPGHGEDMYEVVYDDDESEDSGDEGVHHTFEEDEDSDPEPDKATWPLCYRVLDVDPNTDSRQFEVVCTK